MMRILVIDDEPQIHRFLQPVLTASGYTVVRADTGRAALNLFHEQSFSALLLDLGLPDLDGMEILKQVRVGSQVPIIVISARNQEEAKIAALHAGADDYLEKPFGVGELLARVRAALRHSTAIGAASGTECTYFEGLTIDTFRRLAFVDDKQLVLTPKEWDILLLFAGNAGRVLTHKHILKAVWGSSNMSNIQYLRVYIGQLRQKLGLAGGLISTETGVGYRMADYLPPSQSE